ncbi:MAG: TonB-dependent receptor [Betaproteobacteria bacterium]|nr:TonB-dependent receptor [Betaproteobacteria bacterium]
MKAPLMFSALVLTNGFMFGVHAEDALPIVMMSPVIVNATAPADNARHQVSLEGVSQYHFSDSDIASLPQGDNTPLNEVLLQAPGVVQDGFGQIHVRGNHGNLQYRLNGILIPSGLSGFGQIFDSRMISSMNLLTGALPADYGYDTAGVVDMHTAGAKSDPFGEVSLTMGSRDYFQTGVLANGTRGKLSYNLSASFMTSELGIQNPQGGLNALHDRTGQANGFGLLAYEVNADEQVSFMFGQASNVFQIPNRIGLDPQYNSTLTPANPSSQLNDQQNELNSFQVLSLKSHLSSSVDTQWSLYHRVSRIQYLPDPQLGDLFYTGVSSNITRRNEALGVQNDTYDVINAEHTLSWGLMAQNERFLTDNNSQVFYLNQLNTNNIASSSPATVVSNSNSNSRYLGLYVADQWRFIEHWSMNYGLRFDQVAGLTNANQISPRVNLLYQPDERTSWHMGYANYFTPPANELINTTTVAAYANTTNQSSSGANLTVQAERTQYFDVGVDYRLSSDWNVSWDGYYSYVKNLQDEGQFGNALIYSAFNYSEGVIYGSEWSANYHHDRWSGNVNFSVSRAQAKNVATGQYNFPANELNYIAQNWVYLDHDQRYTLSGSLKYRGQFLTYALDGLFGSGLRSGFANTQNLPAYATLNGSLSHRFRDYHNVEARLTVLNLFDRSYLLRDGTGIGVGAPQYGFRRTILMTMSYPF